MVSSILQSIVLHVLHDFPSHNPFRTAVPFWGQNTWKLTGLSPKRDCSSKRAKALKASINKSSDCCAQGDGGSLRNLLSSMQERVASGSIKNTKGLEVEEDIFKKYVHVFRYFIKTLL